MKTIEIVGNYSVIFDLCGCVYWVQHNQSGNFVAMEYAKHHAIKLATKLSGN